MYGKFQRNFFGNIFIKILFNIFQNFLFMETQKSTHKIRYNLKVWTFWSSKLSVENCGFWKFVLTITSKTSRMPTEYIQSKGSSDSKLQNESIYSIEILSVLEVITKTNFPKIVKFSILISSPALSLSYSFVKNQLLQSKNFQKF